MEGWLGAAIAVFVMLTLLGLGMPIALLFLLAGFAGTWLIGGPMAALSTLGMLPYHWATDYSLMAIPLFIFMGLLIFQVGIAGELFDTAYKWLGRLPGGVAHAVVIACTIFAACTGSSTAGAAAIGAVAMPEMNKLGYQKPLSLATIAAAGSLGVMIPPSVPFVVYGFVTETSIPKLFLAGVLPGLMMSASFMVLIALRVARNPQMAPAGPSFSWKERIVSLRFVWPVLVIVVVIIGGLLGGFFTATEAAAVGSFCAIVLALAKRRLTWKNLSSSMLETGKVTGMIFAIIVGVMVFASLVTRSQVPQLVGEWIAALTLNRYVVLFLIFVLYVVLGMFMDGISMLLITVPIFFPTMLQLGFNPIWYGVVMVLMIEVGVLTPPVAMNVFVVASVAKVPVEVVYRGVWPFIVVELIDIALLTAFPAIVLFVPGIMK